jgi:tetratricopeptide (TPR) repeat protein
MAYLQQGDPEKAEPWLRQVVEARPKDAESRYQLGRALLKAGKTDAAVESFKSAIEQDASRSDIAVDLARAYEGVGRDADAGALYTKLLAGNEPSLELRARAGRYYARTGAPDKAGAQGAKLLEVDPHNAAGLYLKGEGMLAAGRAADARQLFQHAIDADRDPQYLDALGRAAEQLAQDGDRDAQDLALRSYLAAAEAVPPPQNSLIGQGRLYVARNEASKAIPPLLAANRTDPKNADVMLLIGEAYQVLQQAPVALQWLEASVRTGPRAEAFWRIGQLERDANQGARAAEALGSATRLASESEKRTGKPIRWLTDALYLQGRVNFDSHNDAGAREAWRRYVDRKPPASVQLSEVQQLLATSLR